VAASPWQKTITSLNHRASASNPRQPALISGTALHLYGARVGVVIFGEPYNPCGALYWPFGEWCIESMGADALMASNFEAHLSIILMTTKMMPNFNNKCCVSCLVSNKRSPSSHRETKKNEKLNACHVAAADERTVSKSLSCSCPNQTFLSTSNHEIALDYVEKWVLAHHFPHYHS
jgi:hypothetical protein